MSEKDPHVSGELSIPEGTQIDPKAVEIARIWLAKGKQHMILRHEIWEDPAEWGLMLADLAGQLANAYFETSGQDRISILHRIRRSFNNR